jgi:CheY-like chemotaxis protein
MIRGTERMPRTEDPQKEPLPPERPADESGRGKTAEQTEAPETGPTSGGLARRILVVDDNTDAAESLAMLLRVMGYDVRTAHDGVTGLATAVTYQPDLILLDITMPGMNGHELARRLRATPQGQRPTIIAVTALSSTEARRMSLQVGCNAHLTKPLDLDMLEEILVRPWPRPTGAW